MWRHQSGRGGEIVARLISRTALGRSFIVSMGVTAQDSVAAMRNGTSTVVAWDENSGPEQLRKVYVQRVDANGVPLDGRGIAVGNSPRHQLRPALAGSLLAWVEVAPNADVSATAQVWATVLDASGKPSKPPLPIGIASQASRVAVANPGGPLQFILWQSPDNRIMAARFAPSVSVGYDPAPFAVSSGPLDKDPVVSSHAGGFVVAWNREQRAGWSCVIPCFYPSTIRVAAFTNLGAPVGTEHELAPVESSRPLLVWNGAEHVACWTYERTGEAFVQKLSLTATPIGAPRSLGRLTIAAGTWTGEEYRLATWGESLNVARYDRDFTLHASIPTPARVAGDDVAIFDDLLIYLAPYRGTEWSSPRVAARRIGENAGPSKRRATR